MTNINLSNSDSIHLHVLLEYLEAARRRFISIFNEMQYRQLNRRCLEQIIHNNVHDKIYDIACVLFGMGFEEQFFCILYSLVFTLI